LCPPIQKGQEDPPNQLDVMPVKIRPRNFVSPMLLTSQARSPPLTEHQPNLVLVIHALFFHPSELEDSFCNFSPKVLMFMTLAPWITCPSFLTCLGKTPTPGVWGPPWDLSSKKTKRLKGEAFSRCSSGVCKSPSFPVFFLSTIKAPNAFPPVFHKFFCG